MNAATIALSLAIMVPGGSSSDLASEKMSMREYRSQALAEERAQRRMVPQPSRSASAPSSAPRGGASGLITTVARGRGLSESDISMLLYIANKESTLGRNPAAYDSSRKYIGLFQLGPHLGSTEERLCDTWNTNRAISYIQRRYGSVGAAYQFHLRNNWY